MHVVCPPDYGLVVMWSLLAGAVGVLVGCAVKRCPPYEDPPPD